MWEEIENFFSSVLKNLSPKKIIKYIFIALAILIPTILAIIVLSRGSDTAVKQSERVHTVILSDGNGQQLYIEEADARETGDTSLISIFNTINDNLISSDEISDSVVTEKMLTATLISPAVTKELDCYFSFTEGSSYCIDRSGNYFMIPAEDSERFLASDFAEILYSDSVSPTLLTADGAKVTPSYVSWQYQNINGDFPKAVKNTTTSDTLTYDITGGISLLFDRAPDECRAEIYDGSELLFSGNLSDLSQLKLDSDAPLLVNAIAEWKRSDTTRSFGSIRYSFYVTVHKRAEFSIDKTSLEAGEFALLSATHIYDPSNITFSCSDPDFTPIFSVSDDVAYAVIPCPVMLSDEHDFKITVSYGITIQKFTLSVSEEACALQALINQSARASGIFGLESDNFTEHIFINKTASSPTNAGFTVNNQFGKITENLYSYSTQYAHPDEYGVPVTAISAGKVTEKGSSTVFGRYIVVDAGLGMKFIYYNLSSTDVNVGHFVTAGQSVGRTDNISGTTLDGFSVLFVCGSTVLNCEYILNY